MDNFTKQDEKIIINVADEFDYSTQNEEYNKDFREWRKNKNNPFAFNFTKNKKESVYIDGKGFTDTSQSDAENETISRIMYIIGIAMLIWVAIDNIIGKLFISVFDLLGFNIHTNIFITTVYGGSTEIVSALIAITAAKLIIPGIYLHKKLKMPLNVEFMHKLRSRLDMLCSIAMAFLVSAVVSIPSLYNSRAKEIYTYFKDLNTDISVWNQTEFVIYTVFNIIIVSILAELLFRGAVFAALRQFGDWFAVIVTSVMTALLVQDIVELPAAFLISMIASIGMLRSGTVFTSIFVRIIYRMYQLAIVIIQADTSDNRDGKLVIFILATFVISLIIIAFLHFMYYRKIGSLLVKYESETTPSARIRTAMIAFPFSAVAVLCLLSTIIKIVV